MTRRKFRHIDNFERMILVKSLLALIAMRMGLSLFGFRRLRNGLSRMKPQRPTPKLGDVSFAEAYKIAYLVAASARYFFIVASCLEQSLALWWLLRRYGHDVNLRFGARKEAGRFAAHCWVELNGRVLSETGEMDLQFAPFEGHFASGKTHFL